MKLKQINMGFTSKCIRKCRILTLIAAITIQVENIIAESEDLFNTKEITTDLMWTAYPEYGGWEEVSGIDNNNIPIRFYQVCKTDEPDSNNWIRTPYISSRSAKRIYIECEFSIMKCDPNPGRNCRETFNLYIYENDKDVASSTFPPWQERPYVKIDTIAAGQRFTSGETADKGVNRKIWTLGPLERNGFYLAAHDSGACMSLLSLRVYYYYCPSTTQALAYFPRTVAGDYTASLIPVQGRCVENGKDVSSGETGPLYHCNSHGDWKVRTGSCQCTAGHQANKQLTQCQACGNGQYKSNDGNHRCSICPANSENRRSSTSISRLKQERHSCQCIAGFYRSEDEDVHQPCTKPPSAPTEVEIRVNKTWAVMTWSEPRDKGERVDVYYRLSCERCLSDKYTNCVPCNNNVQYIPSRDHIIDNKATVQNLNAFTFYKFKIFALSGVSSISNQPPEFVEEDVMTNQAAPSTIENIHTLNKTSTTLTFVWPAPTQPNGRVVGYQLSIVESKGLLKHDEDMGNIVFVKDPLIPMLFESANQSMRITNLLPNTHYSVKVRAKTAAGYGKFSAIFVTSTSPEVDISKSNDGSSFGIFVGLAAVAVVTMAIIAIVCYFLIKRRQSGSRGQGDSEKYNPSTITTALVVQLPEERHRVYVEYADPHKAVKVIATEIETGQLVIEDNIGQGEFGDVFCGTLKHETNVAEKVAIKHLKPGACLKDQMNFLREASTMAQFKNENVLELKGVVTQSHPFMIVSEFMENGSLDNYLREHQYRLDLTSLLEMLRGITSGMQYLSQMQYVHRDLAARNILVSDDLTCKVSDFGLSRTFENEPNATYTTQGGKIALRWTAPESIKYREFTSSSDVWSFGILMWETLSYSEKPYWNMTNQDVIECIDDGFRLPAPNGCPEVLHKLMIECWAYKEQQRPKFSQIKEQIDEFMSNPEMLLPQEKEMSAPSTPTPSIHTTE